MDSRNSKAIHFDVMVVGGIHYMRFSASAVFRYTSSVGEAISEQAVRSELSRLGDGESPLVHVLDGPFDYYYWTEN